MKSDVMATTHKERKPAKVVSHIEIHPEMNGGHRVETHHTHGFDHPPAIKHFAGPHAAVSGIPEGHILGHIANQLGVPTAVEAAGNEEDVESKEAQSA